MRVQDITKAVSADGGELATEYLLRITEALALTAGTDAIELDSESDREAAARAEIWLDGVVEKIKPALFQLREELKQHAQAHNSPEGP